jgi:Tol biopolymer transport system component
MRSTERRRTTRRERRVVQFAVVLLIAIPASAGQSARQAVGEVTYASGRVQVGDGNTWKNVARGGTSGDWSLKTRLKNGDLYLGSQVRATGDSQLDFYIRDSAHIGYCSTQPATTAGQVQVLSATMINAVGGTSICGAQRDFQVIVNGKWGTVDAGRGGEAKLRGLDADPLIEVTVGTKQAVVKVRTGRAVVEAKGGAAQAVVLGRNQQTQVAANREPAAPTGAAATTGTEKRAVTQVQSKLPPVTDKILPTITSLTGPHNPSSLRTASFAFAASEPGVAFTCALDSDDFRVCPQQPYEHLPPGPHTFSVRATDAAGNVGTRLVTGQPAVYAWTIDGSRIAFQTFRDCNWEIYSMNPDGTDLTNVTRNGFTDGDPAVSPDGKRIAFHTNRDGNYEIYVANADGSGQPQRLTSNGFFDRNPAWTRDGRIVFQSDRAGSEDIWIMNADGSGQTQLTFDSGSDQDPAASPVDASKLAFASNMGGTLQIYLMTISGTNVTGMTNLSSNTATEFNPAWSPDGQKIAFNSDRGGPRAVWVMSVSNPADAAQLTHTSFEDLNPTWAPDGQEIAYQSDQNPQQETCGQLLDNNEIYMTNADGSGTPIRLTDSPGDDLVPAWSSG